MSRRVASLAVTTAVAATGLLGFAGSASADTATIGSTLSHPNTPAVCMGCIGVQTGASSGLSTFPFISPANGVVTSWSVRSGDTGAIYGLRVLRPAGGSSYTSAGASALAPAITSASDVTYHFPTSVPIKQGDRIGVSVDATHSLPQFTTTNNQDVLEYAIDFADGTASPFTNIGGLHELLLQASIQFCNVPSLKRLKTKPAKQALRAHDCLPKVKRSRVKKPKFSGRVLKQKTPAGTTAPPGAVVPIVIGTKK
jgi:hypothetical protein